MGQQPAAESPKACLYLVPVGVLVFFCSFDASARAIAPVGRILSPTVGLSSPYAHHLLSEPHNALVANGVRLVGGLVVNRIPVQDEAVDCGHRVVEGMRSCMRMNPFAQVRLLSGAPEPVCLQAECNIRFCIQCVLDGSKNVLLRVVEISPERHRGHSGLLGGSGWCCKLGCKYPRYQVSSLARERCHRHCLRITGQAESFWVRGCGAPASSRCSNSSYNTLRQSCASRRIGRIWPIT